MKAEQTAERIRSVSRVENRVPAWVMPSVKLAVIILDGLIAAGSFLTAFYLRQSEPIMSDTAWAWSQEFVPYAGIVYFAVPVRIAMLLYQNAFRYHGAFSYTQEAYKVFKAVTVSSLLIVAWAFLFRGGFAFREFSYSRSIFLLDFAIALGTYLALHLGIRGIQVVVRRRDVNLIPTLIVGTNAEAEQTIKELKERADLGYRVVGVLENGRGMCEVVGGVRVIGTVDELPEIVTDLAIQEVIVTDNSLTGDRMFDAMMSLGRRQRVEFRFAPSLFDLLPQKTSMDQIGVLPMVRLFREPLSDAERLLKRVSDVIISLSALALVSPLMLFIALWIKLDSKGSVFFSQERVGMDGRVFLCYKFRSMLPDADENLHRDAYERNIAGDPYANVGDPDAPVYGKVKDDPRITSAGRWLRRFSLDELPQLFNVVTGDMSVVGPRPPIPYEVEAYEPWQRKRLDMKPGITGLWQVSGRNRMTFDEMVRTDLYYIENWSLWMDIKVLLLTLPAILRGDGAL